MEDAVVLAKALPLWYSFYSEFYFGWIIRTGLALPLPSSQIVLLLMWHRGLRVESLNGTAQ